MFKPGRRYKRKEVFSILYKYHNYQSITDPSYFPFHTYRIERTPYHKNNIKKVEFEAGKMNLILNARIRWNPTAKALLNFLGKEPIDMIGIIHTCNFGHFNKQIKSDFRDLFNGFMREFEKDNYMHIPSVIKALIHSKIEVGRAVYWCKGFKYPLFGVRDKNNISYDTA